MASNYYLVDSLKLYELSNEFNSPNVFSPNGDGINDLFIIKGLSKGDRVAVCNRWGTKVFEFAGTKDGWDGRTTSGEECSAGVYYYTISKKNNYNLKGFVHLIRD